MAFLLHAAFLGVGMAGRVTGLKAQFVRTVDCGAAYALSVQSRLTQTQSIGTNLRAGCQACLAS